MNQSNGATINHGQAVAPISAVTREQIADWQFGLHLAQIKQNDAGILSLDGATGGVGKLISLPFTIGSTASPVFTLFDAWTNSGDSDQRDIADGQRIFNSKGFGTNGTLTCATCHNTPNIGSSATFQFFDIGISNPKRRKPDQILFAFRNKATGEIISTLDPGRGLINGIWTDINKFKVPGLRGLAAHGPYFHDGSASAIQDVVAHYEKQFGIKFQRGEKQHLIKFLNAL